MRTFLLAVLLIASGASVSAEDLDAALTRQLKAQGYGGIEVSYTLLGRLRIDAHKGSTRREIVLNPATGETLRDYVTHVPRYASDGRESEGDSVASTPAAVGAVANSAAPELIDLGAAVEDVRQDSAE